MATFMSLPTELRLEIYRWLYISKPRAYRIGQHVRAPVMFYNDRTFHTAIFRVSKKVRDEVFSVLYGESALALHVYIIFRGDKYFGSRLDAALDSLARSKHFPYIRTCILDIRLLRGGPKEDNTTFSVIDALRAKVNTVSRVLFRARGLQKIEVSWRNYFKRDLAEPRCRSLEPLDYLPIAYKLSIGKLENDVKGSYDSTCWPDMLKAYRVMLFGRGYGEDNRLEWRAAKRSRHRDEHGNTGGAIISTDSRDEASHRPSAAKVPRRRSSGLKFFASSSTSKPEPAHNWHKNWEAEYLKDLRVNRPTRPGGSRPFPSRAATSTAEPYARASSALSFRPLISTREVDLIRGLDHERCASALSHKRADSDMPIAKLTVGEASRDFSTSQIPRQPPISPSGTYRENGMRWVEKQEARSLREALEDMDLRDEAKVHAAAQDEASELVWRHRNQGMAHMNADHLRSCKHYRRADARSQSIGWHAEQGTATGECATNHQSVSDASNSNKSDMNPSQTARNTVITFAEPEKPSEEAQTSQETGHALWDSPQKKAYMNLNTKGLPKISGHRRSSGPRARDVSGGLFRNPNDKIYEEPDSDKASEAARLEQSRIPAPLVMKNRNSMSKDRTGSHSFLRSGFASAEEKLRVFRSEIHRNPPSQSRNPSYLRNSQVSTPPGAVPANHTESHTGLSTNKDGQEVRSDDIKAATSMRMRDRSPKLPSPTVVSNRPGRPIVSFEQDWKHKDTSKQEDLSSDHPSPIPARLRFKPQMPESTASAPIVPTINVPDPPPMHIDETPSCSSPSMPSISISDSLIPTISIPDDPPTMRPLPSPASRSRLSPANRPLPYHSSTTPVHSSKLHWTPSSRRATAQCAACALPIEGRIVSAASQRFHPHCFTCHHCAEPLECVAFYPEPDSARTARIERIEARLASNTHILHDEKDGETAADDGDSSLRFYCHLDYHELYSPRCRNCKTPIESEVVLACGGSWHVGHFFCAECGDPFDAKTPFVEKNGYAWCVGCHAGKFSGKCKGCRKPVVEDGVSALGSEWHVDCFCCVECGGQFDDGRFFTRGDEEKPVCVACEERRLKA